MTLNHDTTSPSLPLKETQRASTSFKHPLGRTEDQKNTALTLTSREEDVLRLIAIGLSNKEMAQRLCISIKTIEKHRHIVYTKLGVNQSQMSQSVAVTHYALHYGLVKNMYEKA